MIVLVLIVWRPLIPQDHRLYIVVIKTIVSAFLEFR